MFTALSLNATQDQVALAQAQSASAEQGQITERYSKAVEQVGQQGPAYVHVRLGGIYALERISRDSPRDQPTVIEVLSAFLRTTTARTNLDEICSPLAADLEAAITVLNRRDTSHDRRTLVDLADSCLGAMRFSGGSLAGAHLRGVDLTKAALFRTNLTGANLRVANLTGAHACDAHLGRADMTGATLANAELCRADLTDTHLASATMTAADLTSTIAIDADLKGADLTGAFLYRANLTGANLRVADMTGAHLTGADLSGADLTGADLRGADLTGVRHDISTVVSQVITDGNTVGKWW